ncbi:MAG: ferritin [Clostridiales bacterium]|nr:ferritin [Clostridiales bacterium]
MNKKVSEALVNQVNKEFYSAYLYLAMNQYFEDETMAGMANWMYQQFLEEQFHAMKMVKYLNSRGVKVELQAIERPTIEWTSMVSVFDDVLEHEKSITASINNIQSLSVKEEDFATMNFLQWFIDEQIEEEENAANILKQLQLIGDNGYGLLMLDKELAVRKFVEPVAK